MEGREINKIPPLAFTTSKMQQAAARQFWLVGETNYDFGSESCTRGRLITYHRTDSVFMSPKTVAEFSGYIAKTYGESYA